MAGPGHMTPTAPFSDVVSGLHLLIFIRKIRGKAWLLPQVTPFPRVVGACVRQNSLLVHSFRPRKPTIGDLKLQLVLSGPGYPRTHVLLFYFLQMKDLIELMIMVTY